MTIIITYESFTFISVNIIRINNNFLSATGRIKLTLAIQMVEYPLNLVYIPNLITKLAIN